MMHYIHCHQGIDMNKGGTVGYLSSLLDGMQRQGSFTSDKGLRHAFLFPDIGPDDRIPNVAIDSLKFGSPFGKAYVNCDHFKYFDRRDFFHQVIPLSEALKVNVKKISSVHIHGSYNFLPVYNFLRMAGIENDVVKILTTHNPWKPELEDVFHFNKNKTPEQIERDYQKEAAFRYHMQLRDDFAFRMSDALFFPSEHSMDGYHESWPEFTEIARKKPIYFSVTGTEPKEVSVPRTAMRSSLGIPQDARVFLHLGRFIPMRGFDLFEEAARRILQKHEKAYFVAVGQKRDEPSVKHSRWIEVGHTSSPGDFLNMADACVMANRGSYFDLSMVEALAQGIHLISAKVGGYKYLDGKTNGVTYFEMGSLEGLVNACDEFCQLDSSKLNLGMQNNRSLYQAEMTPEKFAKGYMDTIDCMYHDFGIEKKDRNIANKLGLASYPNSPFSAGSKPSIADVRPASSKSDVAAARQSPSQPTAVTHSNQQNSVEFKVVGKFEQSLEERGLALYNKGLFNQAVVVFYDAVEQNPDIPRLRRQLAESLIAAGRVQEALQHLRFAKRQIPENKNLDKRLQKAKYGKLAFWIEDKPFI